MDLSRGAQALLFSFCTFWLTHLTLAAPPSLKPVAGELLVKFAGGPQGEMALQARRGLGHQVKRNFPRVGWQSIRLAPGQSVEQAIERYRKQRGVLAVQANYEVEAVAAALPGRVPNDPRFTNQWALRQIEATNAWVISTGSSNVVVALIDSGIRYDHEDLTTNMWRNPGESGAGKENNGMDDDHNGYIDDVHGIDVVSHDSDPIDGWWSAFPHGTLVSGPVGAEGNNGRGIAGLNWAVRLMALRFLSQSGNVTIESLVEACNYILDQKNQGVNVRVVNSCWGLGATDPGPAARDAFAALSDAGILLVFAAGDERIDLDGGVTLFPQSYQFENSLTVAASDQQDRFATNVSNWGVHHVDLAAPGVNILTTYGTSKSDYVDVFSGTSFSAPYVSGAAALLAAAYPAANAGQIKTALLLSVDVLQTLTNRVASKGRLNVARAIAHPGLLPTAPPYIFRPPQDLAVGLGSPATFTVAATGPSSSLLRFQWQHRGMNIDGATNAIFTLPTAAADDAGAYRVVVSNEFGSVTSSSANLDVETCPVVLAEPVGQRVVDGSDVTLSVAAIGQGPLSYQWQRNGQNVQMATNATLTLSNVGPAQSGNYRLIITNACGTNMSEEAQVTVLVRPWIVEQPVSFTVARGSNPSLCVTVTNAATLPIDFLWLHDIFFSDLATINGFSICTNFSNIQADAAGTWYLSLDNAATAISSSIYSGEIYVTVVTAPTNQLVRVGQNVSFTGTADGTPPISYQWQFAGTNLSDGAKYGGTSTATLTIAYAQPSEAGEYTLVVRDAVGAATHFPARLLILPAVRLVACSPNRCLEVCWPDFGCSMEQSSSPTGPWAPYTGITSTRPGLLCAQIPVTGQMMFFRIGCRY